MLKDYLIYLLTPVSYWLSIKIIVCDFDFLDR